MIYYDICRLAGLVMVLVPSLHMPGLLPARQTKACAGHDRHASSADEAGVDKPSKPSKMSSKPGRGGSCGTKAKASKPKLDRQQKDQHTLRDLVVLGTTGTITGTTTGTTSGTSPDRDAASALQAALQPAHGPCIHGHPQQPVEQNQNTAEVGCGQGDSEVRCVAAKEKKEKRRKKERRDSRGDTVQGGIRLKGDRGPQRAHKDSKTTRDKKDIEEKKERPLHCVKSAVVDPPDMVDLVHKREAELTPQPPAVAPAPSVPVNVIPKIPQKSPKASPKSHPSTPPSRPPGISSDGVSAASGSDCLVEGSRFTLQQRPSDGAGNRRGPQGTHSHPPGKGSRKRPASQPAGAIHQSIHQYLVSSKCGGERRNHIEDPVGTPAAAAESHGPTSPATSPVQPSARSVAPVSPSTCPLPHASHKSSLQADSVVTVHQGWTWHDHCALVHAMVAYGYGTTGTTSHGGEAPGMSGSNLREKAIALVCIV